MIKKPKISIITVVKNGMPYLSDCLKSFEKQSYKNKELVTVYSSSSDTTLKILKRSKFIKKIIIQKKNSNLYGALNLALKNVTGDLIGILHSDDIFYSSDTLKIVAKKYVRNRFDIGYGNIFITDRNNIRKIKRDWQSSDYKKNKLKFGWMPPHTSLFISKKIKNITYNENYKISADYDYMLQVFNTGNKIKFLNTYITIMRAGGTSKNFILRYLEDNIVAKNFFRYYYLTVILKIIRKLNQFYPTKLNINKKYMDNVIKS